MVRRGNIESQAYAAADRYMTVKELTELFHVTTKTIYRWRDAGKITPAAKVGRLLLFDRQEVEALIRNSGYVR